MTNFVNKFKIPTLLGLSLIFLGIAGGLFLVLREQIFLSQVAPNLTPQNITITNITDDSAVISWQTNTAATSLITFGQKDPGEQRALDDRDQKPKPRLTHYVTLKNLLPGTHYLFKIISDKIASETMKFDTATPLPAQTGFTPIIGSTLDGNNPLNDGVVYLYIQDAAPQSSLIKAGGNFLIPISRIRKSDLSNIFSLSEGTTAKLIIRSDSSNASVLFKLKTNSSPLPAVKLGQDVDLTTAPPQETPVPSPTIKDLSKFDLNSDGKINAADYTIVTSCFERHLNDTLSGGQSCAKADLNGDGVISQKDLDLMSKKLQELGTQ